MMNLKTPAALIGLVTLLSIPAGAAPPPLPRGEEIQVSTGTAVSHEDPAVAVFADGGFVVVWRAGSVLRARLFDRQGSPAGRPFRLLAGGFVHQLHQVVADRNRGFLVAWTASTASRPPGVHVRRFDREGRPQGFAARAELPVVSSLFDAVALRPDGSFAVGWREEVPFTEPEEGSVTNAVAQVFSAQGIPVTPVLTLLEGDPPSTAGDDGINAYPSSLSLAADGTLAAIAYSDGAPGCLEGLLVLVPAGGGDRVVEGLGEFTCSEPPRSATSLAMARDGRLIAAWSDFEIQAQRFAPDGMPRGDWFQVSDVDLEFQVDPAVAVQGGGSFVVVWTETSGLDGDGRGIFGRSFAADGTPRSVDFLVDSSSEGDQQDPAIAAARRGPVVVVWSRRPFGGGRSDVFARVLSAVP